jgi:hypothetical protein
MTLIPCFRQSIRRSKCRGSITVRQIGEEALVRAFASYLSMTWVNIVESILHYMCVVVFVVEEVVLSICRCGSVGSESSKRGAARDSNGTVA